MKKTWFHHTDCTTQQAEELIAEYQRRGVKVERNLNSDYLTWTVSARLPEGKKPPRINRRWQNRIPTFGSHRITQQQSAALGRTATQPANQKAIANLVYGGEWGKEHLGNQVAGDGWKYRGRGLKQITGLSNYRSCGQALKLDLVTHPELLEKDEYAARSAAWFYASRGCLLHSGDIERVTLLINGGRNGLDKRRALFNLAKSVLV
ncbi:glycoside hydrolase family 19 protein [Enterobacter hormaechei]|uniref:glycoside hydrolase family 19 protein n=1 Tax=Enterobacter hormaechei TaxID=158836 RepID=UPI0007D7D37F|nr:glycoside hydrolase family 19 protein [Enterobacter hormaechei]OAH39161.1 endolysin [Enterobacter hormaechei subsp. xiangfangensis]